MSIRVEFKSHELVRSSEISFIFRPKVMNHPTVNIVFVSEFFVALVCAQLQNLTQTPAGQ